MTSVEFKDFALDQLESSTQRYKFSARKMFGDYCIYVSSDLLSLPKPIFLLCDETLFIKQYKELATLLESAPKAPFYKGTKQEWHIVDVESSALLGEIVEIIAPILPEPKPRSKRSRNKK